MPASNDLLCDRIILLSSLFRSSFNSNFSLSLSLSKFDFFLFSFHFHYYQRRKIELYINIHTDKNKKSMKETKSHSSTSYLIEIVIIGDMICLLRCSITLCTSLNHFQELRILHREKFSYFFRCIR